MGELERTPGSPDAVPHPGKGVLQVGVLDQTAGQCRVHRDEARVDAVERGHLDTRDGRPDDGAGPVVDDVRPRVPVEVKARASP